MKRRDFIKNSVGLAGILTTGKFPNILYGQVEAAKLVTDPVVGNVAVGLGLDISKGDITFEADYDVSDGRFSNPDYHPFSKLYSINKGDKQGSVIQVISGLPMTRQTDGAKCLAKLQEVGGRYVAAENMFDLTIDNGVVHAVPLNDQPDGIVTTGDYIEWNPVLKLDGNVVSPISGPILLPVDPVNSSYKRNTLQWNHGICLRRVRIIEGRILERWIFFSNPGGEIRIEHNHKGRADFHIGGGLIDILGGMRGGIIDVIDGDIEVVTKKSFDEAIYPLAIPTSSTFYPLDMTYEDGMCQRYIVNEAWTTKRNSAGTAGWTHDSAANCCMFWSGTSSLWNTILRSIYSIYTGSIPDGDTVSAATFSVYANGTKSDANGAAPVCNAYESDPANNNAIVAADYNPYSATPLSDSGIPYASLGTGYFNLDFNQDGLDAISKIGVSHLGLRWECDADNDEPTRGGNSKYSYFNAYFVEQGGAFRPKLVVTHAPVSAPSVSTVTPAENITEDAARIKGNVTDTGEENPTRYLQYGITGSYELGTFNKGVGGTGEYYHDLSSLDADQLYYFRAYGTNSGGTGYGVQRTFTTLAGGWTGTIGGITDPAKVGGISVADIQKIGGIP